MQQMPFQASQGLVIIIHVMFCFLKFVHFQEPQDDDEVLTEVESLGRGGAQSAAVIKLPTNVAVVDDSVWAFTKHPKPQSP